MRKNHSGKRSKSCSVRSARIRIFVMLFFAAFCYILPAMIQAQHEDRPESATIRETPENYLRGAKNNARQYMTDDYTGDSWTWHARFPMNGFLDAYLATDDTAWLDSAVEYFDWCIGLLLRGPDGRRGWIGSAYRMEDRLGEHPIGDAIMIEPMVRFSAIVMKDEPELENRYGRAAQHYVELAEELKFEKWMSRGIWHEDGDYGVFTAWPWTFTEEEDERWHEPPPGTRIITLPINMQVHWGVTAARLHRITGDEKWRQTALRIFNFAKSRLNLYDGHYSWNYWEPFGSWDVREDSTQEFDHWINTHPYRDYQAGEVAAFVEAYHHGITFDAEDMKRFVRTNIDVMWNGDMEDIQWNNSNAGVQKTAFGEIRLASPRPDGRYAGTLWSSLAPFDSTVRRIYEQRLSPGTHQHAYYHNVTAVRDAGYERRYTEREEEVLDFPFNPCSTITMAAVMPCVAEHGESVSIACQGRLGGKLKIELYSEDGSTGLDVLQETELRRPPFIFNLHWDTGELPPGDYRIRWTLQGEYREFPLEILR